VLGLIMIIVAPFKEQQAVSGSNSNRFLLTMCQGQSLHQTVVRLNAYHAITSASYISQTSNDPILTAFELHRDLKEWAVHEPEFKDEYMRYADLCAKFAVALVSHCRTTEEVSNMCFLLTYSKRQWHFTNL